MPLIRETISATDTQTLAGDIWLKGAKGSKTERVIKDEKNKAENSASQEFS